jgi:hypothetical protein
MSVSRRREEPSDQLNVVLDDATVGRLRVIAAKRGIEVEQLIVQLVCHASQWPDVALPPVRAPAPDSQPTAPPAPGPS